MPYHLVTQEFAGLVQRRLNADGIYVLNLVDAYPEGLLATAVLETLRSVFAHVDIWLHQVPDGAARVTYVLHASNRPTELLGDGDRLHAVTRPMRSWTRVTDRLTEAVPLLTDDNAPVEQLISTLFTTEVGR